MSNTVIPDLDKILAGTEYEDKLENYKKFFKQSKIVTVLDLENCPRYAGGNLCGHSTHKFIECVRDYTLNPPPEPEPEKVKPAPKKKVVKPKTKKATKPVAKRDKPTLITYDAKSVESDTLSIEDTQANNNKEI